jgi:hypothetical protein
MHVLKSLGFRRQGVTLLLKRHVRAPGRQGPRLWCRRRRAHPPAVPPVGLLVWLVADGWCWFVLREKYYWLVAGGWFLIWGKSTASWWLISQSNRARAAQKATRGDGFFSCCLRCGVLHFNKELGITPSIPINQVVLDKISVKYWECKSWITFKLLSLKIWKLYEYICLAKYFHKSTHMLVFNTYFYKK